MNIAIKLPNDLREKVLTFPFLHTLHEQLKLQLEEGEQLIIHLISLKSDIDVLNLLPFHAYYHQLEKDDLKSVFTIHRACSNFNMNTIDCFISTTTSFIDASIGKTLRAKTTIGYETGKNGWVLNKKIKLISGGHKSEQVYILLKGILDEIPSMPFVESRILEPTYLDHRENPYIVINIDYLSGEPNPEWFEFIEFFVNKRFVFMASDVHLDDQKEKLEEFIEKLPRKNTYKVYEYDSNISFAKLVSYSMGFVTHDSPLVNIASYCNTLVFLINIKENLKLYGPEFFNGEVWNFSLNDPNYTSGNKHDYSKIFDELFNYIDDKKGIVINEDEKDIEA